jgi:hypothetical protein
MGLAGYLVVLVDQKIFIGVPNSKELTDEALGCQVWNPGRASNYSVTGEEAAFRPQGVWRVHLPRGRMVEDVPLIVYQPECLLQMEKRAYLVMQGASSLGIKSEQCRFIFRAWTELGEPVIFLAVVGARIKSLIHSSKH